MTTSPADVARRLHSALESGLHGEELRQLFTEDAITTEQPNRLKPQGATATLEQMITASSLGANMLKWQRYDIHSLIEHENLAIIRCVWTAEIAEDVGPFTAGQLLKAHIAQFIEVRDDRVASIETYDCYEPF